MSYLNYVQYEQPKADAPKPEPKKAPAKKVAETEE